MLLARDAEELIKTYSQNVSVLNLGSIKILKPNFKSFEG
jgi:hypothetical protein